MCINLSDSDVLFAYLARRSSRATYLFVLENLLVGEIIMAELTINRAPLTTGLMHLPLLLGQRQPTIPAVLFRVELFLLQ